MCDRNECIVCILTWYRTVFWLFCLIEQFWRLFLPSLPSLETNPAAPEVCASAIFRRPIVLSPKKKNNKIIFIENVLSIINKQVVYKQMTCMTCMGQNISLDICYNTLKPIVFRIRAEVTRFYFTADILTSDIHSIFPCTEQRIVWSFDIGNISIPLVHSKKER